MILPFSTIINKKPSYFPEKILIGLLEKRLTSEPDFNSLCPRGVIIPKGDVIYNIQFDHTINHKPKFHTIREDKNNRWKVGTKIDFFINVRQPNMYRFAPVLPVVRIQRIFMSYAYNDIIEISINGRQLHCQKEILEFVNNDGFDTWKDFFDYFYPIIKATKDNWFEGKLIHWTDLRY